jgi:hypothetical protein
LNIGPRRRNGFELQAMRRGEMSLAYVPSPNKVMSSRCVAVNIPLTATPWSILWLAKVLLAENTEKSNFTIGFGVRPTPRAEGTALNERRAGQ